MTIHQHFICVNNNYASPEFKYRRTIINNNN